MILTELTANPWVTATAVQGAMLTMFTMFLNEWGTAWGTNSGSCFMAAVVRAHRKVAELRGQQSGKTRRRVRFGCVRCRTKTPDGTRAEKDTCLRQSQANAFTVRRRQWSIANDNDSVRYVRRLMSGTRWGATSKESIGNPHLHCVGHQQPPCLIAEKVADRIKWLERCENGSNALTR
jgi:hypothetical protein